MDLDFTQSKECQFTKGEICTVVLPEKPKDPKNEGVLHGTRPCIILSTFRFNAIVLPLTSSKSYADLGFRFKINSFSFSYPRFDMVMPVDYIRLKHEKKYNIINEFGQESFDQIMDYYSGVLKGENPYYNKNSNEEVSLTPVITVDDDKVASKQTLSEISTPVVEEEFQSSIKEYDEYLKSTGKVFSPSIAEIEAKFGKEETYNKLKNHSASEAKTIFGINANIVTELRIRYGISKRKVKSTIDITDSEEELKSVTKNASGTIKKYKYDSSTIGGSSIIDFLNEKTIPVEGTSVNSNTLFGAYKSYSLNHRSQCITKNNFDIYLKHAGIEKGVDSSGRDIYKNIQIR